MSSGAYFLLTWLDRKVFCGCSMRLFFIKNALNPQTFPAATGGTVGPDYSRAH